MRASDEGWSGVAAEEPFPQGRFFNARGRAIALGLLLVTARVWGDPASTADATNSLMGLSVEELMKIEVVTASRSPQKISDTAAAIQVITQDDIRRSGFDTLPDILRLAPGMDVGQLGSSTWAVSARGFNDLFANKLLVMIDGRSLYTSLFNGVFWSSQDLLIEDIERIEVIRGPGASLWGANAVNGVINIITKSSQETQGGLAVAGGGTAEIGFGGLRYGGRLGADATYRVYAKYFDRDAARLADGSDAADGWQMGRTGFRVDWAPSDRNAVTMQGDYYAGNLNQEFTQLTPRPPFTPVSVLDNFTQMGGNALARWTHTFYEGSDLTVQTYYMEDQADPALFNVRRDSYDIDAQYRAPVGERQEMAWGAGYRLTGDQFKGSFDLGLNPDHSDSQLVSAFGQDTITLIEKRLTLTLGSKFEHNDYTGFEIQPSGRLAWTPTERLTLWTAVSRAVKTPSRAENAVRLNRQPVTPVSVTSVFGNNDLDTEKLNAYELGGRVALNSRLSLDVSTYYNVYDDLRSLEFDADNPHFLPGQQGVPPINFGTTFANNLYGESYGVEAALVWQAADWWRWHGSYTFLDLQIHTRPGSTDPGTAHGETTIEGSSPKQQFSVRSSMDLPHAIELDATVRYVDELPAQGIKSYLTMDLRLAWRPVPNVELSLAGQNLLDNQRPEFYPTLIVSQQTEVARALIGKFTWKF